MKILTSLNCPNCPNLITKNPIYIYKSFGEKVRKQMGQVGTGWDRPNM